MTKLDTYAYSMCVCEASMCSEHSLFIPVAEVQVNKYDYILRLFFNSSSEFITFTLAFDFNK